jgi:hypothetical protein
MRGYGYRVDDAEIQAHVDAGVPQPLPGQPPVGEATPRPADEALHYRPKTLVDDPLVLGALHIDAVLHREYVERVDPVVVHIPEKLRERLDKYIEEKFGGRHGAFSWVVEKALIEFLDRESRTNS